MKGPEAERTRRRSDSRGAVRRFISQESFARELPRARSIPVIVYTPKEQVAWGEASSIWSRSARVVRSPLPEVEVSEELSRELGIPGVA